LKFATDSPLTRLPPPRTQGSKLTSGVTPTDQELTFLKGAGEVGPRANSSNVQV
jgi:hypothetical protein